MNGKVNKEDQIHVPVPSVLMFTFLPQRLSGENEEPRGDALLMYYCATILKDKLYPECQEQMKSPKEVII